MENPKPSDYYYLEHATFRVPYEELNRKYRNGHKNIEKTVTRINKVGGAIRMKLAQSQESIPADSVKKLFSTLCQNVEEAQKAFSDVTACETEQVHKFTERIERLKQESAIDDPLAQHEQSRIQTARHAITYLLRVGHIESAKKLAEKYNLESVVDIDVFERIKFVNRALLQKDTKPCLEWIEAYRSKLRRVNSVLELQVRQQDVIDLVNKTEIMEALKYMKKYITPIAKTERPDFLRTMMSLVTLSPIVTSPKYKLLMNEEKRWINTAKIFTQEAYSIYQLSNQSVFSISLQCGLAAHKTPSCKCDERPQKEVECCVCNSTNWPIAEGLPNAHVTVSRILCSMTGEPCDEKNVPYLLPSGHVYGHSALEKLKKGDFVSCPETGQLIPLSDVHRLFFL